MYFFFKVKKKIDPVAKNLISKICWPCCKRNGVFISVLQDKADSLTLIFLVILEKSNNTV